VVKLEQEEAAVESIVYWILLGTNFLCFSSKMVRWTTLVVGITWIGFSDDLYKQIWYSFRRRCFTIECFRWGVFSTSIGKILGSSTMGMIEHGDLLMS
jgi:hypothetical protein